MAIVNRDQSTSDAKPKEERGIIFCDFSAVRTLVIIRIKN